jgi:hypothetical protein
MDRRQFLVALGPALAGCAGAGDPGREPTQRSTTRRPGGTTTERPTATDAGPTTTTRRPAAGPRRGVSLSPLSYEGAEFRAFFEEAAATGSVVRWAGDWADLGTESSGAAAVAGLASRYEYTPVVEVGVADGTGALFRPLDRSTRDSYVGAVESFAASYQPPYLGLGVEVNRLASADQDAFERYVGLYSRAREAVKAASPTTRVYAGWQLEWLRGRRDGLWGEPAAGGESQWELLDRLDSDLLALTTYPHLVFREPEEVPADYYTEVTDRVGGPVAITETGWPAALALEGWESDEAEQRRFVERLGPLLAGLDLRLLVWLHLYQQGEAGTFSSVTLKRADGSPRPALAAWERLPGR